MKRKILVSVATVALLLVGLATVAFAADNWKTPAQIVSDLTGKTTDQALADRQAGQSYGAQAAAAGKLSQFQQERLAQCKQRLDAAVNSDQLTQAEADKLYEAMKTRMATCTGTGTGNANGLGYGMMGRGMMGTGRLNGGCGLGYGQGNNID